MTNRAVPHATVNSRSLLAPLALFTAVAMLLAGLCGSASAAKPIGKGGSIQACYKFKGKKKGSLRVVPTGKGCKRGERKLTWSTTSAPGQAGATGAQGTSGGSAQGQNGAGGSGGANGANGTNGTNATLESKIAGLNLKIDGLEGILKGLNNGQLTGAVDTLKGLNNGQLTGVVDTLDGITKGELTGALATVEGVTNGELTGALDAVDGLTGLELSKAVDSLPALESLCTQVAGLTGGLDSVNKGVKGLTVLGLPSLSLGNLGLLPNNLLSSYTCIPF